MAENPQPRGFDVNQPGSGRETGIGLLRGLTTDLVGGVVDFFPFLQYSIAPTVAATMPDAADKLVGEYGSKALEEKFFGLAPTEELQTIRDDAALASSAVGLTEIATAKAAKFLGRQIDRLFQRADGVTVAVTPDGTEIPVPKEALDKIPETSVVENIGGQLATSGQLRKQMLLNDIKNGVSAQDSYESLGAEIDPAFAGDVEKGFRFQIPGVQNAKLLPDHFQDFNDGSSGFDIGVSLYSPNYNAAGKQVGLQTFGGSKTVFLPEVLDYPELYDEYPFLRDVEMGRLSNDAYGGLASAAYGVFDGRRQILVKATTDMRDFQKSILHEVQHAIQDYEPQMMVGSDPETMTTSVGPFSFLDEAEGERVYYTVFGEAEARVVEDTFDHPLLLQVPPSQRRTKPRNLGSDRTVRLPDEELVMITDTLSDNAPSLSKIPNTGIGPFAALTNRRPVKTYHGSGTDFDEFSMSAVGTGEGAQMYGHGLYLSDLEDVGQYYRDQVGQVIDVLADPGVALEERAAGFSSMGILNETADATEALIEMQPEIVEIDGVKHWFIKETEENANENFLFTELPDVVGVDNVYSNLGQGTFRYMYPDGTSVVTRSKNAEGVEYEHPETGEFGVIVEFIEPSQGKVMKVDMDIDPKTEMLDYFETLDRQDINVLQKLRYAAEYVLREQPVGSRATLKPDMSLLREVAKDLERVQEKGKLSRVDGMGVLDSFGRALGVRRDAPEVSDVLRRFGRRGTKYYTAGSRGRSLEEHERTYNYVVFDDTALKITDKYREGGAVTADHGIAGFIPYMVQ